MLHITKKTFIEHSNVHTYGSGHSAIRVLYFDWQAAYSKESGSFAGYKYAICAQFMTKAVLINKAYKRIVLNERFVHTNGGQGFRVALTDKDRFKVQIAFNSKAFKYTQEDFDKTSYYELTKKRKEREKLDPNRVDDLPF